MAEPSALAYAPSTARWRELVRRNVLRRFSGRLGLVLVTLVVGLALFGPSIATHDPFAITGGSLRPPTFDHPMGTDALGRDVFSGVLYGARTSLVVASIVAAIAAACGTIIGMVAGYRGGWADNVLMRATELFQVIPRFFFVVVAIALFGPGLGRLVFALGLTSWPTLARVVRGEVIALRELDFIRAAHAAGTKGGRIATRQLLPNVLPSIVVVLGLLVGQVLLLEATLGFLGLGDPDAISWGMMAAQAQGFLRVAWWLALFPGLAISLTVLGVNLLADAFSSARHSPAGRRASRSP